MPFSFEQRVFIVENYLKYGSFKMLNAKCVKRYVQIAASEEFFIGITKKIKRNEFSR